MDLEEKLIKLKIVFENLIKNNKLSHAYLLEGDNYQTNEEASFLLANCIEKTSSNASEIKVIKTDTLWIKKEEINSLREDASKTNAYGGYKIYIINNAEKLNKYSANSLLKFLEDPESKTVIILTTTNRNQMIGTIISRCQKININTYIEREEDVTERSEELLINCVTLICSIESKGAKTLCDINKLWYDWISDSISNEIIIETLILFYKDLLNCKTNRKIQVFHNFITEIQKLAKNNSEENIIKKINHLAEKKELIKYNANTNLLIDNLIIYLSRSGSND